MSSLSRGPPIQSSLCSDDVPKNFAVGKHVLYRTWKAKCLVNEGHFKKYQKELKPLFIKRSYHYNQISVQNKFAAPYPKM